MAKGIPSRQSLDDPFRPHESCSWLGFTAKMARVRGEVGPHGSDKEQTEHGEEPCKARLFGRGGRRAGGQLADVEDQESCQLQLLASAEAVAMEHRFKRIERERVQLPRPRPRQEWK